jgi:tight adherence protein B
MSTVTHVIGIGAAVTGTLTWLLVVLLFFSREDQAGSQGFLRYRSDLERKLRFLRLRQPGSRIVTIQVTACCLTLALALLTKSLLLLTLVPLFLFGPKIQFDRMVARRITMIEELIEPWLNAVANALKASPSLGEAIASSSSLVASPMSEEIDLMVKEYELGTSLDQALEQFAQRIDSRTLAGAVLALKVARNSGGNLPETLENAANALRELARLEGVVRTKTAEGKAQAFVIGIIPIPMVLGIHEMDGHFFDPLIATFAGHLVIGGAVVLWLLAIVLTTKILAVDI